MRWHKHAWLCAGVTWQPAAVRVQLECLLGADFCLWGRKRKSNNRISCEHISGGVFRSRGLFRLLQNKSPSNKSVLSKQLEKCETSGCVCVSVCVSSDVQLFPLACIRKCVRHTLTPTLSTGSNNRSREAASLQPDSSASSSWKASKQLQWRQLRPLSSQCPVFQEVQREAGVLHNMQNTHTQPVRGRAGREQVEERAPDAQSLTLFLCFSQSSALLHTGTVLLQPLHLLMNNAQTFFFSLWMNESIWDFPESRSRFLVSFIDVVRCRK